MQEAAAEAQEQADAKELEALEAAAKAEADKAVGEAEKPAEAIKPAVEEADAKEEAAAALEKQKALTPIAVHRMVLAPLTRHKSHIAEPTLGERYRKKLVECLQVRHSAWNTRLEERRGVEYQFVDKEQDLSKEYTEEELAQMVKQSRVPGTAKKDTAGKNTKGASNSQLTSSPSNSKTQGLAVGGAKKRQKKLDAELAKAAGTSKRSRK